MKDDKDLVLSKGFIPYMAKVFGFLNNEKFIGKNIYKLEGLEVEEMRELLLSDINEIKAVNPDERDIQLQKLFTKIYSFQPTFTSSQKRELRNTEQRLYADIVLTPGFLDDEVIRDFLLNRFKPSDKNSLKNLCLIEIVESLDKLSPESKEKFAYCYRSSSKFARALLYDDRYFSKILNDRKLSMFNKETFSQLFRFSDDYHIEAIISQLLLEEDDKSLFVISQMCNHVYEQVGHTSEFMLSVASILNTNHGHGFKSLLVDYYDRVIGDSSNEKDFQEAIKDNLPYELREMLNVVCDFSYSYSTYFSWDGIDNLDKFIERVKERRLDNHILVFGEEGLQKFKDGIFDGDFRSISTKDELDLFKIGFLQNIYGITLSQAKYFVSRYGDNLDKLKESILDSDKSTYEILKSLSSITSLELDNHEGIKLLQEAYLKYMSEKGLDFQKQNNSSVILEGLFNRMYMNTYKSILYNDLSKVLYVDDGIPVVDAGVDFSMIVTSLNGTSKYFENGVNIASKWNTAFRDIGQGLCTSFINNQNLGVISLNGPLLGFSNIHEDALNTMGVTDIYSYATNFNLRMNYRRSTPFIVGSEMANETRYGYNEMLIDRFNATSVDGEVKIQPDYVVFYKTQDNYKMSKRYIETLKTAKDFGIPIVVVDFDKVQMHEKETIKDMEEELFSSDTVNKDLLVGIMTRYMNNISGCRTIHGPTSLGGLGVSKYIDFPEKALGNFIDSVLNKCNSDLSDEQRNEWIDALQEAYDNERRKHMAAISTLSYHCSIGNDNADFILVDRFNLADRLIDVHNRYGRSIKGDDPSYREGDIPYEFSVLTELSNNLGFNSSFEVDKVVTNQGKNGYSITKKDDSKDVSLEEKIIIAYLTDNYEDDLISDMMDTSKDKIYFGTPKEIANKTINSVSLVDRLNNSYLSEEIKSKGIDMDKVNGYIDKIESMEEKTYLSIFNDYIYHVKEVTAYSQLFIADKFLEKKNNIREEFNKLSTSLGSSVDEVKSK